MPLRSLTPMLRTPDVPATIRFWTDVLGFRCLAECPEGTWASLGRDGVEVMISALNRHEGDTEPTFSGSLSFRCDDVDALWETLRDSARICYALETFDYGMREFAVYDNNGYLLQFGQPVGGG